MHLRSALPTALRGFAFSCLLLSSACGCKKDDPQPATTNMATALTGEWRLVSRSGGLAGTTETFAVPGPEYRLVFSANGQYAEYFNGAQTLNTTWMQQQDTSFLLPGTWTIITVNEQRRLARTLSATQLVLMEEANDGFTSTYQRYGGR